MSTALQHLEEAFVRCGEGKDFFGGDSISYLDIALGSHVGWVKAVEKMAGVGLLDEAKVPNLAAWADRLCAHPAVVDAIPDADKFVEFYVKYGSSTKKVYYCIGWYVLRYNCRELRAQCGCTVTITRWNKNKRRVLGMRFSMKCASTHQDLDVRYVRLASTVYCCSKVK